MSDMSVESGSREPPQELKQIFAESEDPALTAVEVADELEITQQAAHKRLSQAHDRGEVQRKKTGARSVIWWVEDHCVDSR